jgi:hypothetical protein
VVVDVPEVGPRVVRNQAELGLHLLEQGLVGLVETDPDEAAVLGQIATSATRQPPA